MATRRLTRNFFAANALDPAERLTVTIAGIISGAMPTAIAREKRRASMNGLESATLTMKMNAVKSGCHPEQESREPGKSHFECRLALVLGQARRNLPKGGSGACLDNNSDS